MHHFPWEYCRLHSPFTPNLYFPYDTGTMRATGMRARSHAQLCLTLRQATLLSWIFNFKAKANLLLKQRQAPLILNIFIYKINIMESPIFKFSSLSKCLYLLLPPQPQCPKKKKKNDVPFVRLACPFPLVKF